MKNKGMRIDTRWQLRKERNFMKEYQTDVMKACRTHMAKRIQTGIERWKGNSLPFEKNKIKECAWCREEHGGTFYEMMTECEEAEEFREEVKKQWSIGKGEKFDEELLFGCVRKKWWNEIVKKKGASWCRNKAKAALKWWEEEIRDVRRQLEKASNEGSGEEDESVSERTTTDKEETSESEQTSTDKDTEEGTEKTETSDSEEEGKEEMTKTAQRIRKFDVGEVKKGEPELKEVKERRTLKEILTKRKK